MLSRSCASCKLAPLSELRDERLTGSFSPDAFPARSRETTSPASFPSFSGVSASKAVSGEFFDERLEVLSPDCGSHSSSSRRSCRGVPAAAGSRASR